MESVFASFRPADVRLANPELSDVLSATFVADPDQYALVPNPDLWHILDRYAHVPLLSTDATPLCFDADSFSSGASSPMPQITLGCSPDGGSRKPRTRLVAWDER
jgi:hypothetical protein